MNANTSALSTATSSFPLASMPPTLLHRAEPSTVPLGPSLMTEVDAALALGLSVKTLRCWRLKSRGPRYVKLGRAVRYNVCDIAQFVSASAVSFPAAEVCR